MKFLLDFYLDFNTVHAEQSEASLFNAVLRSNAFGEVADARCEIKTSFISLDQSQHSHPLLTLAPSGVDRWFATLIENIF